MPRCSTLGFWAALLAASPAAAHVAAAVDDNNRYVKASLLGDQVRLAYTIFFGERPGAILRHTLDANRDGIISTPEAQAFGRRLGDEVVQELEVSLDGLPLALRWSAVEVGLGEPATSAGSFAVDLVAWLCASGPPGPRLLTVRDRYPLALPGETGLRVEDAPGIVLESAHLGRDEIGYDATRRNVASAFSAEGWRVRYQVRPDAARGARANCVAPRRRDTAVPTVLIIASVVVAVGAGAWCWRRLRA